MVVFDVHFGDGYGYGPGYIEAFCLFAKRYTSRFSAGKNPWNNCSWAAQKTVLFDVCSVVICIYMLISTWFQHRNKNKHCKRNAQYYLDSFDTGAKNKYSKQMPKHVKMFQTNPRNMCDESLLVLLSLPPSRSALNWPPFFGGRMTKCHISLVTGDCCIFLVDIGRLCHSMTLGQSGYTGSSWGGYAWCLMPSTEDPAVTKSKPCRLWVNANPPKNGYVKIPIDGRSVTGHLGECEQPWVPGIDSQPSLYVYELFDLRDQRLQSYHHFEEGAVRGHEGCNQVLCNLIPCETDCCWRD